MSHAGERMVKPVLAGKSLMVIGNAGLPHSFTYVPDLAAAMISGGAGSAHCGTGCGMRRPALR